MLNGIEAETFEAEFIDNPFTPIEDIFLYFRVRVVDTNIEERILQLMLPLEPLLAKAAHDVLGLYEPGERQSKVSDLAIRTKMCSEEVKLTYKHKEVCVSILICDAAGCYIGSVTDYQHIDVKLSACLCKEQRLTPVLIVTDYTINGSLIITSIIVSA